MSIPLQKLPYLAQKEVLSTMEMKEIFIFATLSKKNERLVKTCLNTKEFQLTIFPDDDYWVIKLKCLRYPGYDPEFDSEECRQNGLFLGKTVNEVLEFIVKVFQKLKIHIHNEDNIEKFPIYSRFFKSIGVKIDKVFVDRCKQGELQDILKAFKGVLEVKISSCKLEEGIQFDKTICYHFESIEITTSRYMDIKWRSDLLISLIDCRKVLLLLQIHPRPEAKFLPTEDLEAFLKRWVAGSKMEHFRTQAFDLINFPYIFESLGEVIPVRAANFFDGYRECKHEFKEDQCFLIQQKNNGPKAIVYVKYNSVNLETDFELI
uniref:F-box domain-containing protein n=1 Tax=Caenorhabditis tropicalis TaxID=1561998 RepID=A0A1I7TBH4_9PELO